MNKQFVAYITGGGTGFFSKFLEEGGGSKYLLEGNIPYATECTKQILGYTPEHYSSEHTARQLAIKAFFRAIELAGHDNVFGVASTAKLPIEGGREGRESSFSIAIQEKGHLISRRFVFNHNLIRRLAEEINSTIIYNEVRSTIKDSVYSLDKRYKILDKISDKFSYMCKGVQDVFIGGSKCHIYGEGDPRQETHPIIFPGSFNPFHKNHLEICRKAYKRYGKPVWLELCLLNTDKPMVDYISLQERVGSIKEIQDESVAGIIITNTPLFQYKMTLYRKPIFLVGSDTAKRIVDPRYLNDSMDAVRNMIYMFRMYEVEFLVFQRLGHHFDVTYDDKVFKEMEDYVDDGTSSTKLRKA